MRWIDGHLLCISCGKTYPVVNGIIDLRAAGSGEKAEVFAWSNHWSEIHQECFSQKFFSLYRKTVFARTVRYFTEHYFPPFGIFLEAGSGTSETSMRIDKKGGARLLVAIDIVLPILSECQSIMDVRVCGDIFHLPFQKNSLDGVWNVGVMEHFNRTEIDQIMREYQRALKRNGRVILLWPGTGSLPQKILSVAEKMMNLKRRKRRFQFHPEEISQLKSGGEGRNILEKNGFKPVHIDSGLKTLMAFKTLIGEKNEANQYHHSSKE